MLPSKEPDGQFNCYQEWVGKAQSWIGGMNALCLDAKNREIRNGGDMKRAEDEGAFPVRFWFGLGPQTKKQQKQSIKNTEAALRLRYPWRYQ